MLLTFIDSDSDYIAIENLLQFVVHIYIYEGYAVYSGPE